MFLGDFMKKLIMIKYGELTTKGDNRGTFIKLLEKNIKNALVDYKIEITYDYSRMFVESDIIDETFINKIKNIFGIYSVVKYGC